MLLNQNLELDQVRWAIGPRQGFLDDQHPRSPLSYDSRQCFLMDPPKTLLSKGTHLHRLIPMATGLYFTDVWWMQSYVFHKLLNNAMQARHGGGKLFRNYVAEFLALPKNDTQLCTVEIELAQPVYAWVGRAARQYNRPGGMDQVFLPNLAERGQPHWSPYATVVKTSWLTF